MPRFGTNLLFLAAMLAGPALASTPQDKPADAKVLLRRKFVEGDCQKYLLRFKGTLTTKDLSGDPRERDPDDVHTSSGKVVAWVTLSKVSADGKEANEATEVKSSETLPKGDDSSPVPPFENVRLDHRNRILDVLSEKEEAKGMDSMFDFSSPPIELPDKEVKVGDTWEAEDGGDGWIQKSKLTATLVGEVVRDGVPTWHISVRGAFPIAGDMGDPAGGSPAQKVSVKGQLNVAWEEYVDKATCTPHMFRESVYLEATVSDPDDGPVGKMIYDFKLACDPQKE